VTPDQLLDLKIITADLRHLYMNLAVRKDSPEKIHDQGLVSRCVQSLEKIVKDLEIPHSRPTKPDRPGSV